MSSIIPFAFEDHLIRVVKRGEEPWFVGRDVCHALHISNESKALATLDPDEREDGVTVSDPIGREQSVIVISEPGVYRLVFRSRKPEAERFKRWLAHEVLPAIRKNGFYRLHGTTPERAQPEPAPDPASERLLYKLGLVREARLLFGPERARGLWHQLGLPAVPPAPPTGREEARACLRHLLETPLGERLAPIGAFIERALDDEEEARIMLLPFGVRVLPGCDGFLIANRHPALAKIFAGTEWADGHWARVLRRLSGVVPYRPVKFGGCKSRGTLVPAQYLDEATVLAAAKH